MTPLTHPLKQATIRHITDGVPWYPIKPGAYAPLAQVLSTHGLRATLALHQQSKLTAWRQRDQASVTLALTLHAVTILPPTKDALTDISPTDAITVLTNLRGALPTDMHDHLDILIQDLEHFTPQLDGPAFTRYLTALYTLALYVYLRVDQLSLVTTRWDTQATELRIGLYPYLDPTNQTKRRTQLIQAQLDAIHSIRQAAP